MDTSLSSRRDAAVVAVGVALLAAAVTISTVYTRMEGDLDWSNYTVGLIATAALLALGGAGAFLVPGDAERKGVLSGFPLAFGIVGVGLMITLGMDSNDAAPWVVGVVVTALGAGAYVVTRQTAVALSALFGVGVLYAKIFTEIFDGGDGDNALMTVTIGVFVFTALVSAAAWFLPCRDAVVITTGAFATAAYVIGLIVTGVYALFFTAFAAGFGGEPQPEPDTPFHNDVWVTLVLTVLLMALWFAAYLLSGNGGYRLLSVLLGAGVLPAAMFALAVEHPTWWSAVAAVIGALVLGAVLVKARTAGPDAPGGAAGPDWYSPATPPPAPAAPAHPTQQPPAAAPFDPTPPATQPIQSAPPETPTQPGSDYAPPSDPAGPTGPTGPTGPA